MGLGKLVRENTLEVGVSFGIPFVLGLAHEINTPDSFSTNLLETAGFGGFVGLFLKYKHKIFRSTEPLPNKVVIRWTLLTSAGYFTGQSLAAAYNYLSKMN